MAAYQLELELEEIYAPLKKLGKFKAESDGKAQTDTGNYRSVLIVTDSAVTAVLRQILTVSHTVSHTMHPRQCN